MLVLPVQAASLGAEPRASVRCEEDHPDGVGLHPPGHGNGGPAVTVVDRGAVARPDPDVAQRIANDGLDGVPGQAVPVVEDLERGDPAHLQTGELGGRSGQGVDEEERQESDRGPLGAPGLGARPHDVVASACNGFPTMGRFRR